MDGQRFDELTRVLATGVSRRRIFGMAAGSAAAVATMFRRRAGAAPSACAVGCANLKGPQKAACTQACRQCGGDFDRVCVEFGPFGPVSFTCCPEGTFCVAEAGVCCEVGTQPCFGPGGEVTCCPEGTFCNFEVGECQAFVECIDCTENPCGIDPLAVCGVNPQTGLCLCAQSVEDACTCVQPICGEECDPAAPACPDGFACIVPDCCGFPTCAPLCETPLGAAAATTTRWDN